MVGDTLDAEIDRLTWQVHELDFFYNAWICAWLAMLEIAETPEQRAICRYEIEAWNKVRSRAVQAVYAEINAVLAHADRK